MKLRHVLNATAAALFLAAMTPAHAQQVGKTDIGGVVTSANGPEAGVWVIAETTDLPTKFAKIVVTDDQGRYVHARPAEGELQRLGARLRPRRFAEGRRATPGKTLNLKAVVAPTRGGGAEYYPADLLVLDAEDSGEERVPGTGRRAMA